MRDQSDIRKIKIEVAAVAEIDLERVQEDPIWDTVSRVFDLEDPEQFKAALEKYVAFYLTQENLLENAPFTNGPASAIGTEVEVLEGDKKWQQ